MNVLTMSFFVRLRSVGVTMTGLALVLVLGCGDEPPDGEIEERKEEPSFCEGLSGEDFEECRGLEVQGADLLTNALQPALACDLTWKCCWTTGQSGCTETATSQALCQNSGQTNHCNSSMCRTTCNPSAGNCKCAN